MFNQHCLTVLTLTLNLKNLRVCRICARVIRKVSVTYVAFPRLQSLRHLGLLITVHYKYNSMQEHQTKWKWTIINLHILGIRATGRTFREDPITIRRSTSSLSCFIALWNNSGRFSPKKTMSGFIIAKEMSGHLGQWGTTCKRFRMLKAYCCVYPVCWNCWNSNIRLHPPFVLFSSSFSQSLIYPLQTVCRYWELFT